MKKLALVSTVLATSFSGVSAGELENLRSANAVQKKRIVTLENEIDNLYSLLEREMRLNGRKPHNTAPKPSFASGSTSNYVVVKGDTLSKIARQYGTTVGDIMRANKLNSSSILRIGQKLTIPAKKQNALANNTTKKETKKEDIPKAQVVKVSTHQVASGDTFYAIARKHKVSVVELTRANPTVKPSALRVGMTINVPGSKLITSTSTSQKQQVTKQTKSNKTQTAHKQVEKKETSQPKEAKKKTMTISVQETPKAIFLEDRIKFSDLARKHNTTVAEINKLNDWDPPYPGDTLLARGSEIYIPE